VDQERTFGSFISRSEIASFELAGRAPNASFPDVPWIATAIQAAIKDLGGSHMTSIFFGGANAALRCSGCKLSLPFGAQKSI
jgi:hypothetical protein